MVELEKTKKNPLGPIGENVRLNVARYRAERGLSYTRLSDRLANAGRPIPTLGLARLEKGERRVDADDLVALAEALEVTVEHLLAPQATGDAGRVVALQLEVASAAQELREAAVQYVGAVEGVLSELRDHPDLGHVLADNEDGGPDGPGDYLAWLLRLIERTPQPTWAVERSEDAPPLRRVLRAFVDRTTHDEPAVWGDDA